MPLAADCFPLFHFLYWWGRVVEMLYIDYLFDWKKFWIKKKNLQKVTNATQPCSKTNFSNLVNIWFVLVFLPVWSKFLQHLKTRMSVKLFRRKLLIRNNYFWCHYCCRWFAPPPPLANLSPDGMSLLTEKGPLVNIIFC